MYKVIKSLRPDVPWLGGFGIGGDAVQRLQDCDVLCSEPLDFLASGWTQQRPRWWSGITARFGRTAMDNKPPIIIIHACPGLVWRHTTLPQHENKFWLAQVVANGGNLWHTLTGVPVTQYDQRILEGVARFNAILEANEEYFTDLKPITPVAMVSSRQSMRHTGAEELYGFIESLTNHQIPFALLSEEHLTKEHLASYEVLVLPGVSCLSDDQLSATQNFVERGGGIVASYETGLYDETGDSRDELVLHNIFSLSYKGHRLRNQTASYMRIEEPGHPIVKGIGNTQFIYNELDMLQMSAGAEADVPLTLVPPFGVPGAVGSPPERASIPTKQTQIPVVVCKNRSVYFAGEMGRLVWQYRMPDHQDLIANAIRHVAPNPMPVETDCPHSLQIALYRQGKRWLLHLVNTTGERPLQDTIPLMDIGIRMRLSEHVTKIRTLIKQSDLEFEQTGNVLLL